MRQEVSGHDFSRALRDPDLTWASAPAEALPNARMSFGSRSLNKKVLFDFKSGSTFLQNNRSAYQVRERRELVTRLRNWHAKNLNAAQVAAAHAEMFG